MKKIINKVENIESEMISGMVKAYPEYIRKLDNSNVSEHLCWSLEKKESRQKKEDLVKEYRSALEDIIVSGSTLL